MQVTVENETQNPLRVTVDLDPETMVYLRQHVVTARLARGHLNASEQVVVKILKAIDAGEASLPIRVKRGVR
jgi:DNA primase